VTILGLGIDLVEVERVGRLLSQYGDRAFRRVLTPEERAYCEGQARPAQHVAVRMAAKEAAYKALSGDGDVGYIPWRDVEVTRDADGRPGITLHGSARVVSERLGVRGVQVSLTHSHSHAAAIVILLG
jgi:holo-[acyl-carrier protein] synthase